MAQPPRADARRPHTSSSAEVDPHQAGAAALPPTTAVGVTAAAGGGLAAGALAVSIGVAAASVLAVVSPIDAVGSAFIDRTPRWLKEWAIDTFGTDDKLALRIGIYVVLALAGVAAGVLHRRHRAIGPIFFMVFAGLGAWAAVTRAYQSAGSAIPAVLGAVVGAFVLDAVVHQRSRLQVPGPSKVPLGWDRRRFLAVSGATIGGAAVLGALGKQTTQRRVEDIEAQRPDSLPPATDVDTAAPADATAPPLSDVTPFVTPTEGFYRIDTALSFPLIGPDEWTLDVVGMVDNELTITYEQLLAMPMVERTVTICCVSNEVGGPYIGNAVWQGVRLDHVLGLAGVQPGAEQLFSTSQDGWTCGFPTSVALDGRDCLIAVGMNGKSLPIKNGFPARLIVPGLYGYVSATKWLRTIELTTWDAREGYWVPRGWAREAPIKTQSRIDVPRRNSPVPAGVVAIAGVAWAQQRGIERVEVRIDEGDWQDAQLATDVSDDTWRQWWYEWTAEPGEHTVQVRATDKLGDTQTEIVTPVAPDGATGYHTRRVMVTS